MSFLPFISIVLGSFNRYRFLRESINCIRNNGIEVPYEIIVIDGGSKDGSTEWLIQQPDILTIVQHNRTWIDGKWAMKNSWGYFMNLGFKMAKGKYILMISDDCLLHPDSVMNGYNLFEKQLEIGRKIGGVAFYFRDFPEEEKYYVWLTLGSKMYVNHGMYLREVLQKVNFIDEDYYRFYYADEDLCLKIWQAGFEIIDSPNSYVEHCNYASTKVRKSNPKKEDMEKYINRWKNIYNVLDKNNFDKKHFIDYFDRKHIHRKYIKISLIVFLLYCYYKVKFVIKNWLIENIY